MCVATLHFFQYSVVPCLNWDMKVLANLVHVRNRRLSSES